MIDIYTEKIEKEVFKFRDVSLRLVVSLGNKNKKDHKLPLLSEKEYQSDLYTNVDHLKRVNIYMREYIVFAFFERDEKPTFMYFSPRHLYELENFFDRIIDNMYEDDLFFESKKLGLKVNKESKFYFREKVQAAGSSFGAMPCSIDGELGVRFYFGSKKCKYNLYLGEVESILYYIKKLDLVNTALQMVNIASANQKTKRGGEL